MMQGSCLCGEITVTVTSPPDYINICNCKLCRGVGAAWAPFASADVAVRGETHPFRRNDIAEPWLETHFCGSCGTTTHYVATERGDPDRVVVNTRIFDLNDINNVEVRYLDGQSVASEEDEFPRIATGHIGDGRAF